MKKSMFAEGQIAYALKQAELGTPFASVARVYAYPAPKSRTADGFQCSTAADRVEDRGVDELRRHARDVFGIGVRGRRIPRVAEPVAQAHREPLLRLRERDEVGRADGVPPQKGRQRITLELPRGSRLDVLPHTELQGLGCIAEHGWEEFLEQEGEAQKLRDAIRKTRKAWAAK